MRIVRVAALAALSSLALFPSAASAGSACWYPNESRAAQVRGLQTMLMVGTLQCRNSNRYSVENYGDFVTNQRPVLDSTADVLKAHFLRETGSAGGQRAYDAFATSLANRYSAEMDGPAFCDTVDEFVRLAANASRDQLMQLAEAVAEAPDSRACGSSPYRFDTADVRTRQPDNGRWSNSPPIPRVAVAEAVAVPDPEPPAAAPAAADAKVAVIEKVVAAAAPIAAPAATPTAAVQPSKDEALKAAIVALQSAITALQAATVTEAAAPADPSLVRVPDAPIMPPQDTGGK